MLRDFHAILDGVDAHAKRFSCAEFMTALHQLNSVWIKAIMPHVAKATPQGIPELTKAEADAILTQANAQVIGAAGLSKNPRRRSVAHNLRRMADEIESGGPFSSDPLPPNRPGMRRLVSGRPQG